MKRLTIFILILLLFSGCAKKEKQTEPAIKKTQFLSVNGLNIVNENGDVINLKGINLGGWMLIEPWIIEMKDQNGVSSGKDIFDKFEKRFGKDKTKELYKTYMDNFITEDDIKYIASLGINFIRIPFWHRAVFDTEYTPTEFYYLDKVIAWAKKYNLYCLIDMHGAPGGQNTGVNILGESVSNQLWYSEKNKNLTVDMWKKIAQRYKDEPIVAGYDLLNEAWGTPSMDVLIKFYNRIYKEIRKIDKRHIIFIEDGLQGIHRLPNPKTMEWKNIVYSFHFYPDISSKKNPSDLYKEYLPDLRRAQIYFGVPFNVGEFNPYSIKQGGIDFLMRYIEVFNKYGWSWNYWTYKKIGDNRDYRWGLTGYSDELNPIDIDKISFYGIKKIFSDFNTNNLKKDIVIESVFKKYCLTNKNTKTVKPKKDNYVLYPEYAMIQRSENGTIGIEWGRKQADIAHWYRNDAVQWQTEIKESGVYKIIIEYASGAVLPTIELNIDNLKYSENKIEPNGNWDRYTKGLIGFARLSKGIHTIKLKALEANQGLMNLRKVYLEKDDRYKGNLLIPSYDKIILSAVNFFDLERKDNGICVEWQNSPGNIGCWHNGESAIWKFNIGAPGFYKMILVVSAPYPGSALKLSINSKILKDIKVPVTDGWHKYIETDGGGVELKSGENTIKLTGITKIDEGLGNLREIRLYKRLKD